LKDYVTFHLHWKLVSGERFGCTQDASNDTNNSSSRLCDHLCTHQGRYCAWHARNLSGYAVVRESLRRACIAHTSVPSTEPTPTNSTNMNLEHVWQYWLYHREHCFAPHDFNNDTCVAAALEHAGWSAAHDALDACMGDIDSNTTHPLLEQALLNQRTIVGGQGATPSWTVQSTLLKELSSQHVFESVCHYYWDHLSHYLGYHTSAQNDTHDTSLLTLVPPMCRVCGSCPDVYDCLRQGVCTTYHNDHPDDHGGGEVPSPDKRDTHPRKRRHRFWKVLKWLFFLAMVAGVAYYAYVYWWPRYSYYRTLPREDPGWGSEGAGSWTSYFQMT
jgi:hypothetical protein